MGQSLAEGAGQVAVRNAKAFPETLGRGSGKGPWERRVLVT